MATPSLSAPSHYLSATDFQTASKKICAAWKQHSPSGQPLWTWQPSPTLPAGGYLYLSPVIKPIQSPHHGTPPHIDNTNDHDDDDPAVLSASQQKPVPIPAIFSYSIIYSQSYSCPVLYIRITDTSGSGAIPPDIAMKSILELMTTTADDHHHHNTITTVSYEEHPGMNNCPCIMIHPCQTEEIMDLILSTNSISDDKDGGSIDRSYKYLVAWLTVVVGKILQLNVPIQICQHDRIECIM
jgi:hypothetical protein